MPRYILGLGSSSPVAHSHIQRAIVMLDASKHIVLLSSAPFFLSPSAYGVTHFRFINSAVAIKSLLSPLSLLLHIRQIEQLLGRIRMEKNNSRTLDIDILYSPDLVFKNAHLTIPHPCLHERDFALTPAKQALKIAKWAALKNLPHA